MRARQSLYAALAVAATLQLAHATEGAANPFKPRQVATGSAERTSPSSGRPGFTRPSLASQGSTSSEEVPTRAEIALPPKVPALPPPIPATLQLEQSLEPRVSGDAQPKISIQDAPAQGVVTGDDERGDLGTPQNAAAPSPTQEADRKARELALQKEKQLKDIRSAMSNRKQTCQVRYNGPRVIMALSQPPSPVSLPFTGLRGCLDAVMAEEPWLSVRTNRGAEIELHVSVNDTAKARETPVHVVTPSQTFTITVRQAASK